MIENHYQVADYVQLISPLNYQPHNTYSLQNRERFMTSLEALTVHTDEHNNINENNNCNERHHISLLPNSIHEHEECKEENQYHDDNKTEERKIYTTVSPYITFADQDTLPINKHEPRQGVAIKKPLTLIPPFRFACVECGVYRGAYPTLRNLPFLYDRRIKTIVSFTPEALTFDVQSFASFMHIELIHIQAERFKGEAQLLPMNITQALEVLIDVDKHPVYLHCLDGRHVSGLVILALRKLQNWDVKLAHLEYLRFTKEAQDELSFIGEYNGPVNVPRHIPRWLWQGSRQGTSIFANFKTSASKYSNKSSNNNNNNNNNNSVTSTSVISATVNGIKVKIDPMYFQPNNSSDLYTSVTTETTRNSSRTESTKADKQKHNTQKQKELYEKALYINNSDVINNKDSNNANEEHTKTEEQHHENISNFDKITDTHTTSQAALGKDNKEVCTSTSNFSANNLLRSSLPMYAANKDEQKHTDRNVKSAKYIDIDIDMEIYSPSSAQTVEVVNIDGAQRQGNIYHNTKKRQNAKPAFTSPDNMLDQNKIYLQPITALAKITSKSVKVSQRKRTMSL